MAESEDPTTEENVDAASTPVDTAPSEPADSPADSPEAVAEDVPAVEQTPAAEPVEVLAPKERRARARAAKAVKVGVKPERSGAERQADRDEERVKAAKARRTSRAKAATKYKSEAHSRSETPAREHVEGRQKVRQGVVTSDKADKTITVRIDVARRHRKYAKVVRTSQSFHAHDETNDAHTGDTVTIRECRPLSRSKRWRLVGVVERAR